ncbi:hypothetical protein EJB05_24798, partial [Eragrostis curvula]
MDAKVMTIVMVVLVAHLAFKAKSAPRPTGEFEGHDRGRSTGGLHQWQPDSEEIIGSNNLFIVPCVKTTCRPNHKKCYCCAVLPNVPCYGEQKRCWDNCPAAPPSELATAPSSSVGEQQVPKAVAPAASASPGHN